MNLCPKCSQSRWPFVMIFAITSLVAAMTWLVLGLSSLDSLTRALIALGVFLGVGGTMLHYVVSCLRRHCRHDHGTERSSQSARQISHKSPGDGRVSSPA